MGHRVELGEIEVSVNLVPGVQMAACVYDAGRQKIVLCYVGEPDEKALTAALKTHLPRYMLPNRIVRLEQLPFTANGKIDRVSLSAAYGQGR